MSMIRHLREMDQAMTSLCTDCMRNGMDRNCSHCQITDMQPKVRMALMNPQGLSEYMTKRKPAMPI